MSTPAVLLAVGAAWGASAVMLALLIGRCIRNAQPAPTPPPADDWMALVPTDCLSAHEVDARFAQIVRESHQQFEGWL